MALREQRENLKPDCYQPTIHFRSPYISLCASRGARLCEIVYLTRLWIIVSISCAITEKERERKREKEKEGKTVEYRCQRGDYNFFQSIEMRRKSLSIYVLRIRINNSISSYRVYRWNNICIAQKCPDTFLFCNSSWKKEKKIYFIIFSFVIVNIIKYRGTIKFIFMRENCFMRKWKRNNILNGIISRFGK